MAFYGLPPWIGPGVGVGSGPGSPRGGKGADAGMSEGKAELVRSIKELQRSGPEAKQQWEAFCTLQGVSKFDPAVHDEDFLANFFVALETGSLATAPPPESKLALVQKVKDHQRRGPEQKQLWYDYCTSRGNANFDPNRHEEEFLQGFFRWIEENPKGAASSARSGGSGSSGSGNTATSAKLFIGGLDKSTTTEDSIRAYFSHFGAVKQVEMKYDTAGACRGFAFVTFETPESAQLVLDNYSSNMIDGKWIECKPATAQQKPPTGADGADWGDWGDWSDWGSDWGDWAGWGPWAPPWGPAAWGPWAMPPWMGKMGMLGAKGIGKTGKGPPMAGPPGAKGMGKMGWMQAMMGMGDMGKGASAAQHGAAAAVPSVAPAASAAPARALLEDMSAVAGYAGVGGYAALGAYGMPVAAPVATPVAAPAAGLGDRGAGSTSSAGGAGKGKGIRRGEEAAKAAAAAAAAISASLGAAAAAAGLAPEQPLATIFVGALPRHGLTQEVVEQHFSTYGEVRKVELKYDADGNFRGFAFVTFADPKSAQAVFDNYEHNMIMGKWVDCKPAAGGFSAATLPPGVKRGPAPEGVALRVRGLPFSAKENDVLKFFDGYETTGRVIMKMGSDGRPSGDAFVEFTSQSEAYRAYNDRNFAQMGSRYVELLGATPEDTLAAFGLPAEATALALTARGLGAYALGSYGAALAGLGRSSRASPYGW